MEDRVPAGLFDAPKRGFNLPIGSWAQRHPGLLNGALDRLAEGRIIRRPSNPRFTNEQTWSLLVLDRFLDLAGAY